MNVAGPKAREVLAAVGTDIDLSPSAFPHMTYREGRIAGVEALVERVSFSGELSYVVAGPRSYGAALWDCLMRSGRKFGFAPFGIAAAMVLRDANRFAPIRSVNDRAPSAPTVWSRPS